MVWSDYWVWYAAALVLAILEILIPGYILLGFAISAGVVGTVFYFGGGFAAYLASSMPVTLVGFSVVALVIWLVMRQIFGNPRGQVKIWDTDINDN